MARRDGQPFAVNTYSYTQSHAARACLAHLAERGYREFELMMYPGHLWPADTDAAARRELWAFVGTSGLRVVTLNMPNLDLNIAGATEEMRGYSLGILRGIVEFAGDLGVPGVIIGPGKANPLFPLPADRLKGHLFRALDELVPRARRAGTALYVENMPFAFLPDADGLMRALDDHGADEVGVVYDVANGVFIGEDPAAGLRRVRDRLRLVHLSDTGRRVYRHDPVGRGVVPFALVPPVLEELGHREPPVLEIISRDADRDIAESAGRLYALGWPRGRE